jgi:calcineurin-like phosphoesterase family protein
MISWHRMGYGSWMLHGHSHGNLTFKRGKMMDVGVDTNPELAPYSYREVEAVMQGLEFTQVDHHKEIKGEKDDY